MKVTRFQIIVALVILGIGFTGGYYLELYQQNQYQILVIAAVIIAFLTWFGSGADLLGLLREWYKDQQTEKFRASFNINYEIMKEKHPLQSVFQESQILTLKIDNDGGGETAQNCSGRIEIEGIVKDVDALNWLYKTGLSTVFQNAIQQNKRGVMIQEYYVRNWNVPIKHGFPEYLDVLATIKDDSKVYVLDADKTKLEIGNRYNITVVVVAKDIKSKKVTFCIDIPDWQTINVTNFADA